ncbi:unnamed protein product, partial [Closterium sp. NIES-64]
STFTPGLSACDVPSLTVDGKVGDASGFRVWGYRAFVRDLSADKLSPRAAPCVFLGFPTDAPGWQFYHPSSRHVLSSQDVTFDESVPFYRSSPTHSFPPPPPDFLGGSPPVRPPPPSGSCPLSLGVLTLGGTVRGGAEPGGATAVGAEPGSAEPEGGGLLCLEVLGLGVLGRELLSLGVLSWELLSLGVLRLELLSLGFLLRCVSPGAPLHRSCASGSLAAGGVLLSLEVLLELELELLRPSRVRVLPVPELLDLRVLLELELLRAFVLSLLLLSGAAARPRPYFVPLLQQVLGLSPPVEGPPPVQSQSLLELLSTACSLLPTLVLLEVLLSVVSLRLVPRRLFVLLALVVAVRVSVLLLFLARTGCLCVRPLLLCVPLCLLLLSPLFLRLPTLSRTLFVLPVLLGECALSTDVLEDRQEELQCLAAASPHLASVLLAPEGDPDALDIPTPRSYAEAVVEGPYSSQWQAAMDAEMASWKSTGTYVDAVPPPGANIVSGMWIFRVKRPPGSPPVFKARYVARGFSQRQGVDYFQTFSPPPKMTTLRVLLRT